MCFSFIFLLCLCFRSHVVLKLYRHFNKQANGASHFWGMGHQELSEILFWVRLLWQRSHGTSYLVGCPYSFQTSERSIYNRPLELYTQFWYCKICFHSFIQGEYLPPVSYAKARFSSLSIPQWPKQFSSDHFYSQWNEYLMVKTSKEKQVATNGRPTAQNTWLSQPGGLVTDLPQDSGPWVTLSFSSRFYNQWFHSYVM